MNHIGIRYRSHVYFIVSKCGFGDWLILLRLLENVEELVMVEILREIRMAILGQKLPLLRSKKPKEVEKTEELEVPCQSVTEKCVIYETVPA